LAAADFAGKKDMRGLGIANFGFLKGDIDRLARHKPAKLLATLRIHDAGPAAPKTWKIEV